MVEQGDVALMGGEFTVDELINTMYPHPTLNEVFPEAARACALMGAQIIFYPTAIGVPDGVEMAEGNWQEAWENVMRGHAIANNVIVAAVNRCGKEDAMNFWGGSFVCDAFGKTLARAGEDEEVLICSVDLAHSEMVREGWRFFYNRRPETYKRLTE